MLSGLLSGCGSPEPPAAPTSVGSELSYDSFGTRAGIDCGDRRSLRIGGSNNTVAVTGTCGTVTVTGADNKLRFERIADVLTVTGLNNTVVYQDGEPEIRNTGTGNDIRRG